MLSSLVRPIRVLDASRLEIRLWWDNITPFGCPVVPEVYTIIATWDSSRRSRGQAVVSSAHISWRRLKLRCPSLQPCSRSFLLKTMQGSASGISAITLFHSLSDVTSALGRHCLRILDRV